MHVVSSVEDTFITFTYHLIAKIGPADPKIIVLREITKKRRRLEMRGKAKRIACSAPKCHPLASSSETEFCLKILSIQKL